jgi:tetratricopeptide (TPR) repeat protein
VSLGEMRAPPAARREFERGLEQVRRGDTAAAERFLRKAVEIYPAYTRAWVELGRLHAAAHRADQALECFDAALRHDPADPEALRGTARLLNDRGRHLEALRAAAQLEQLGSGDARSHLEIARGLLGAGKPAEAEAAARRLESEPHAQAPEVHLVLYQIAQSRQDRGAAAAELRAYLKEVGESAAPHARQALDRLEAELAATPSAEDLSNEGARLAQAGQVDQAIDAYQRALRLNPGLTPVQLNLGIAYFRAGRYAEAEAPLRRFLSVNAGHAQALHLLGLCLLEQQTYADAAAQLAAARAAGASDFALLFALAVAYQRGGQPEQAQAAARALLEERGDSAEAHLLLGIGHAQGNENEKAVEAFQAARRVNPKLPWVHKWLAETLMKMNREDEAVPLYREELRINSRDSEANYQLGAILERRNQDAEAETLLSNALRFRPEYGEASYTLGKLYLRQNRLDPARPLLERAARLLPDNPSAHYQLGRLYQRLGRAREAQEQFAITEKLQQAAREKARDAILP